MVSFNCQTCGDTVKKPKLSTHMSRCKGNVDCLDCSQTFDANTVKLVLRIQTIAIYLLIIL